MSEWQTYSQLQHRRGKFSSPVVSVGQHTITIGYPIGEALGFPRYLKVLFDPKLSQIRIEPVKEPKGPGVRTTYWLKRDRPVGCNLSFRGISEMMPTGKYPALNINVYTHESNLK